MNRSVKISRYVCLLLGYCLWLGAFAQNRELADKTLYLQDSIPIHFVYIPSGSFIMGSEEGEPGRDNDESPLLPRTVEKGFYLGKYEVTQAQWLAIMHHNPAVFQQRPSHLQQPIEHVSWSDCQVFIEKLNRLGIGIFRLPTEEEWEYACRAGTDTRFYWGEEEDWTVHRYAWANSRSMARPHRVGQKPANKWGLYDMSGNVWEWCSTNYGPYDKPEVQVDSLKVFRGGGWFDFAAAQRCANRHKHGMDKGYTSIGLRLALKADE